MNILPASENACCFFGHRNIILDNAKIMDLEKTIEQLIQNTGINTFLFGGYGSFDSTCKKIVDNLRFKYPHIKRVFVQAYYKHENEQNGLYDEIIYPEIENKPKKFAITYRNRYIVDMSSFCIFFVSRNWGGANYALEYAIKTKKPLINMGESKVPHCGE